MPTCHWTWGDIRKSGEKNYATFLDRASPATCFPLANYDRLCFLKNVVSNLQIIVEDYTHCDDYENVANFEKMASTSSTSPAISSSSGIFA